MIFLLALSHFAYSQIEFKPGSYYSSDKEFGKIKIEIPSDGEIILRRNDKVNFGAIISNLVLQNGDSDIGGGSYEYNFERLADNPNHYMERVRQSGIEYVSLLRVYEGYALFSTIRDDAIIATYAVASTKAKVKEIAESQVLESLVMYPKDEFYPQQAGEIIFSNTPIIQGKGTSTSMIKEYKIGDPLFFRCFSAEMPYYLLLEEFPSDNDLHHRKVGYELFFDGKMVGSRSVSEYDREYNPEGNWVWQECLFAKNESCPSTLGNVYYEKLLIEHADWLTVGEHTLTVKVCGFNSRIGKRTNKTFVEGTLKFIITEEDKQKALSQSFVKAGMQNASLENVSLAIVKDYFPSANYYHTMIKSTNFTIVRHEITGIVLYRTFQVYAFSDNNNQCNYKVFQMIQDFNGSSYEDYLRLDEHYVRGEYKNIPCASMPK